MKSIMKKSFASFLAAGMLLTSVYIPAAGASGTVPGPLGQLLGTANYVYSWMTDEEKADFNAAQAAMAGLADTPANESIVDPVWDEVEAMKADAGDKPVDRITREQVLELFAFLGTVYEPSTEGPGTLKELPDDLRATIDQMIGLAGLEDSVGTFTKQDFAWLALQLESEGWYRLSGLTYYQLIDLLQDKEALHGLARQAIENVLYGNGLEAEAQKFKSFLVAYGIESSELYAVMKGIRAKSDSNDDAAIGSALAYVRGYTQAFLQNPMEVAAGAGEDAGKSVMKIYGVNAAMIKDIPVTALTWESDNELVSVGVEGSEFDRYLAIKWPAGTVQRATISATFDLPGDGIESKLHGRYFFSQDVVLGVNHELEFEYYGDVLVPGSSARVYYNLHGFLDGQLTDSMTLDIQFDPNVFELATGNADTSVHWGPIPPADITYDSETGTLHYLVADPSFPKPIKNGTFVYYVDLKVKADAVPGLSPIATLEGNNIVVKEQSGNEFTIVDVIDLEVVSLNAEIEALPTSAITSVTPSVTSHTTGTAQNVDVAIATSHIHDGVAVQVELVKADGTSLETPVKATGSIAGNAATVSLSIPAETPAGAYKLKVTVGSLTNSETIYNIAPEAGTTLTGYVALTAAKTNKSGVTVTLKQGGTTIATDTTDAAGLFEVTVEAGTYDIEISYPGYLKRTLAAVVVEDGGDVLSTLAAPVVLTPGDINGDALVNAADYSVFLSAFGSSIANAAKYRAEADFNGDALVNAGDYSIFLANYGKTAGSYTPWVKP